MSAVSAQPSIWSYSSAVGESLLCESIYSEEEAGMSLNSSSDEDGVIYAPVLMQSPFSADEAGISLESESDEDIQLSKQNSSVDEGGISLDSTSDELSNDSPNTDEHDFENVYAKKPPKRHVSSFLLSEVSSGKKMRTKATSLLSIKSALREKCSCGNDCVKKMTASRVREERSQYWTNSKTVRMQLLINHIAHSETHGRFRFMTMGKLTVCSKAFCAIYRINKNTFSRGLEMNRRNVATIPGRNPRVLTESTLILINWFEDYATYHGDRMPDSVDVMLPYKTVKTDLFLKYRTELLQSSQRPVGRSQFFKIWNVYFPHLKIKKTNSFSKCTTCMTLEKQMEKTTSVETRAKYRQMKDNHNSRQMLERKYYYGKRERSRKNPAGYLSVIIDGMDQAKTNLPHFTGRLPKNIKVTDLLKTHVTGVISHGHGGFHTFLDVNEYPHDPNLTLNVLLKMLKRTAEENENKLPPTLYIQADNCSRENKNRYVLAFCELLVRERIFNEVHLSFLYVGHTHEDVDAGFSKIAEKLRKTDVEIISDLLKLLPKCEMLSDMFDIKSWLVPELKDISGVSVPLHFKFQKVDNDVVNFYKGQHSSVWINMENILASVPKGEASLTNPDYSKIDCDRLLKQTEVIKELFKNQDSFKVWQRFYSEIKNAQTTRATNSEWILKGLPRQETDTQEMDILIPEDVLNLVEKDNKMPKILIRKKNKPRQKAVEIRRPRTSGGRKKPAEKKKKNNSDTKGGSRKRMRTQPMLTRIPLTDDVKKHIWLMIFLDLVECFIFLCLFLFIILDGLFCLISLLNCISLLYQTLLLEHTGAYNSCVRNLNMPIPKLQFNLLCNVSC